MDPNSVLVDLARQDAKLYQLRQQIQNLPRRIADLDAEAKRLDRQTREAEGRFEQAESARRKLETELAEFRAKRAKSESRLATLTSTEQYQALVKEMQMQAERIDALESAVLEALERSETVQEQTQAEKARVAQGLQVLRGQQEQLRADLNAATRELPQQTQLRNTAVAALEPTIRPLYERILSAKKDVAVALVDQQTCGICKAIQPPQTLQLLRQRTGLQACQMCGRILVWSGE